MEDTQAFFDSLDLVHSSHTFEHLADPGATLAEHRRTPAPDSLHVVETPIVAYDQLLPGARRGTAGAARA
jgi:hypothetical protein